MFSLKRTKFSLKRTKSDFTLTILRRDGDSLAKCERSRVTLVSPSTVSYLSGISSLRSDTSELFRTRAAAARSDPGPSHR